MLKMMPPGGMIMKVIPKGGDDDGEDDAPWGDDS